MPYDELSADAVAVSDFAVSGAGGGGSSAARTISNPTPFFVSIHLML